MRAFFRWAVFAQVLLAAGCSPAGPRSASTGPLSGTTSRAAPDGGSLAPPAHTAAPEDAREREMERLVNEHRVAVGCGRLEWDAKLARVARAHSASMRAEGYFDHVDAGGRDAFARVQRAGIRDRRMVAENIALTGRPPAEVLGMWLASPGHRANLENCDLTRHGIGRVQGFWTHVFTG